MMESRSGLSVTAPMGAQFRVLPVQFPIQFIQHHVGQHRRERAGFFSMMHNGDHENFCIARTIDHAKRKAPHAPATCTFERRSPTVWIGDCLLYRAFRLRVQV